MPTSLKYKFLIIAQDASHDAYKVPHEILAKLCQLFARKDGAGPAFYLSQK